jgi:ElaA protein
MLNDENISLNFEANHIDLGCKAFHQLSKREVESIMKIKSKIFSKDQSGNSNYENFVDHKSLHFLAHQNKYLVAYARLVSPSIEYQGLNLERFCVEETRRGQGISRFLMEFILNKSLKIYPNERINLSCLKNIKPFYEKFGFNTYNSDIEDDGLEHFYMTRD